MQERILKLQVSGRASEDSLKLVEYFSAST